MNYIKKINIMYSLTPPIDLVITTTVSTFPCTTGTSL